MHKNNLMSPENTTSGRHYANAIPTNITRHKHRQIIQKTNILNILWAVFFGVHRFDISG